MKELTKQQRHEIYKLAYAFHLADIFYCKINNKYLDGMCGNIHDALIKLKLTKYSIKDLPEFIALKPRNKSFSQLWWKTKNTSSIRKKKYELIIKQTI